MRRAFRCVSAAPAALRRLLLRPPSLPVAAAAAQSLPERAHRRIPSRRKTGAGVFVLTGIAAKKFAGPAVVLSYGIAGAVGQRPPALPLRRHAARPRLRRFLKPLSKLLSQTCPQTCVPPPKPPTKTPPKPQKTNQTSGGAALISALSYAEYAVELPVAGGAFNYIAATYGEFAAWCARCAPQSARVRREGRGRERAGRRRPAARTRGSPKHL